MGKKEKRVPKLIRELEQQSMLYQASLLSKKISGHRIQWENPYGYPQAEQIRKEASVWIDLYPPAILTCTGESVLEVLAEENLWQALEEIGIQAMHTNPISEAGGITRKGKKTPSIDAGFDRSGYDVDQKFGTNQQYQNLVKIANLHGGHVAGDIVPCHTGKNADFRLAEKNYLDYPGLYTMIEIAPEDWQLLPKVKRGKDAANLPIATVSILIEKGYLPAQLPEILFSEPGIKESNWTATDEIVGVDGINRRWVYLNQFKTEQPALNWLDPSMNAQKVIFGDIIKARLDFGIKIVRLDANPLLALEKTPGSEIGISRGHPLSVLATNLICMFLRKLGGWSFEENIVAFDGLKQSLLYGPELSYDFATRSGYAHAMLTGNASLLNLQLQQMEKYEIDPGRLMHSLQNHDCLNYDMPHFSAHSEEIFIYKNEKIKGKDLAEKILTELSDACKKLDLIYSPPYSGVATTYATMAAGVLNIPYDMCTLPENKEKIKKALLPMLIYNMMQPGIFQLSGWDLVGALNLPKELAQNIIKEGDVRWLERGSYDLMGTRNELKISSEGVPRATILFGDLPSQLKDPNSFVATLKKLLHLRKKWEFALAKRIYLFPSKHQGTSMALYRLPNNKGLAIVALNFSHHETALEELDLKKAAESKEWQNKIATEILTEQKINDFTSDTLKITLSPLSCKVILIT
jgi:trehalose synthase